MSNTLFQSIGTSIFETMSRLAGDLDAINLGQGFPEGLEAAEVIDAAARALIAGPHQYPPMMGLPALRAAVADNARRFHGFDVDWEREVLVTSGATEALADAFFGLFDAGDEVILFEPVYDSYATILRRAGAIPVPVRLDPADGWRITADRLAAAITPRTRGLVINTPWNPVGRVISDEELSVVADALLAHDLVAVADEVYEHLVFDGHRHRSLFGLPAVRDRVVRIGSAGKTFSVTGWKVGYITADAKLLAPIARAHQFITFTTPPALQTAVAFGLSLPDGYFAGLRQALAARRDLLIGGLRDAGFEVAPVEATYFALLSLDGLDTGGDAFAFARRLAHEAGVATIPISAFSGERDIHSHVRLCFAKSEATLDRAIRRLAAWRDGSRRAAAE